MVTMKTRAAAALGLALLSAGAFAQEVSYEKYKLGNGMTVILHKDDSLPVAAINLWYYVGAKDEPKGRSGFAHLFEHLMFMGTERVPGSNFDTIMEAGGGANNATTSSDRTNYFASGPAELLPTLLWLEADRLEDLARTMDQEKLDKQRDVVRNERRQNYENEPYGKAELKIQELMYPVGHPYHIPVIGTHEDLEAATVGDVKDFFAQYYVPRNLSLAVAGSFDVAETKKLIERLFGGLPTGQEVQHRTAPPVRLDEVRRATLTDKVQLPLVSISYHSPAVFAEGDAEMDLAAAILAGGKTSRLYKRLVIEDKLAAEVSAYQGSSLLGSEFRVSVLAVPDADLEQVEKTIDEELARFAQSGPTPEELEQRKATFELGMLRRLQSIEAKADQLNSYEFHLKEPGSFKWDLDRYRNATAGGVQSWAAKVLNPHGRVIMRVLPEAPERGSSPRDKQPSIAESQPFSAPLPTEFALNNGIRVMLWEKPELPLVAMTTVFHTGGIVSDSADAGAVYLAADMLDEGAGNLDAVAFSEAMQSLGAQFGTGSDHESISTSLTVLKRNFEAAAGLAMQALRRPRFDEKEWERVKRLHLEELKQMDDQPAMVAARVAARSYFGDEHPYGRPLMGTSTSVEALQLPQVKAEYDALVRPEYATILLAGDVSPGEAKNTLDRLFGDWTASQAKRPDAAVKAAPKRDRLEVFVVDRPEAVQTVIRFVTPGPTYHADKRIAYRLLNTLLGGSFTSRLNMNLREVHGYTYGARSSYAMQPAVGYFVASSSVRADVTGESVKEFLHEFDRISKGDISPEEAVKARETLRAELIQSFAGLGGVLAEAEERIIAGKSFASLAEDMKAMQAATAPELNQLAQQAIPLQQGVLVLVGDKKVILEQIKDIVPAPVELDVNGTKVGA